MQRKDFDLPSFIVKKRKSIERIFGVIFLLSLLCIPLVGINYDLTKYLPEDAPTTQAIEIMEEEFTYPGMGRVMLTDVSLYEAKAIKDQIAKVEGVDTVTWCDTSTIIYGSDLFIDYDDIEDYYKDGNAYMEITFLERDSSPATHQAVREIEEIVGERGIVGGSATADTNLGPTINKEVSHVLVMAVIVILTLLALTTTSWFEPLLFLMIMGIAILLNMGTNLIFGEISFLANAVGAVLQLACSIDYSIFLLNAFTREHETEPDQEKAMAAALHKSFPSILASGATTIVGFLALALMRFKIGQDMGFVLAKGIVFSLLTVLLLMPSLILRFQKLIQKTSHRPFLSGFHRLGKVAYRLRIPVLICVLLLLPPCYIAQGMNDYSFGNEGITNAPGTEFYANEQMMNEQFGQSNVILAMVPVGDNVTEKELAQALEDLPYVRYVTSLTNTLPDGVPEEFLPRSLTGQLHSEHWARLMVSVRSSGESEAAYQYTDEIRTIVQQYYPEQETYLLGVTPSAEDIRDIITVDYNKVNILSILGVALVVALTYKKLILPLVVLIPIESAIIVNTAFPYLAGDSLMYLGFIIVSCIQLGATIDYSILLTGNYLEARKHYDKKNAAIRAVGSSALSICTSGLILTCAGYGFYFLTSNGATQSLGHLVGRGALLSTFMVLFMLPACLTLFDRFITHSLRDNFRLQLWFWRRKHAPATGPAKAADRQKKKSWFGHGKKELPSTAQTSQKNKREKTDPNDIPTEKGEEA